MPPRSRPSGFLPEPPTPPTPQQVGAQVLDYLTAWGGNATQAELCRHLQGRGIDPEGNAVLERPHYTG
jgi:hypothetical protein